MTHSVSASSSSSAMPWYYSLLSDARYESHAFLEGPYARVPKEVGCAFAASFLVSPLVSILDKAIVQEVAGVAQLTRSIKGACYELLLQPKTFFNGLSFRLTFVVYFGLYAVANCSEAALDFQQVTDEASRKKWKVGAASTANVSLLAWRDSVFVRTYTGAQTPLPTPLRTLGMFGVRDAATMISTFYLAPMAADVLVQDHNVHKEAASIGTSLLIPVASQFVTAPIHILAIDSFMRRQASVADRWAMIRREYAKVCLGRGVRILPAFGIGSYTNNKFRELTIRQPDEELLLSRRLSHRIEEISGKYKHR